MTGDRHLVVAYNFPPFADASAVTQAKRIVVAGTMVDVVSQDLTGLRTRDETLFALVAPFIDRHDVIPGRPQFVAWPSMREFATRGLRRLEARGPLTRYASVYSRSMWPHSHVLAALVKVMHPEVRWTAEFSDPLLHHVDGSMRRSPLLPEDDPLLRRLVLALPAGYRDFVADTGQMLQLIQALPFGLADNLVFTNGQQQKVMVDDLRRPELASDVARRSEVSPHPTPPPAWVQQPQVRPHWAGTCRIGYFGTLYPNRGLGSITEAIRLLPDDVRGRLCLDVYTAQRESTYRLVQRSGVADVIRVRSELPYSQFLQVAGTYEHLLVTDTRTGGFPVINPFLPSKVSDYGATTANIFAITVPGSELSRRNYRPAAVVDDVCSIRDALLEAVTATT